MCESVTEWGEIEGIVSQKAIKEKISWSETESWCVFTSIVLLDTSSCSKILHLVQDATEGERERERIPWYNSWLKSHLERTMFQPSFVPWNKSTCQAFFEPETAGLVWSSLSSSFFSLVLPTTHSLSPYPKSFHSWFYFPPSLTSHPPSHWSV